ncbi:MAG: heavy-metal-associated domain-containing protein [Bryobacteraceae bacterium]
MDRRNFLHRVTTGAATLGAGAQGSAAETREVSFHVKGFTCITCAIGLEVLLKQQPGITRARASYPDGRVVIGFDGRANSPGALREFINRTTGFTVAEHGVK